MWGDSAREQRVALNGRERERARGRANYMGRNAHDLFTLVPCLPLALSRSTVHSVRSANQPPGQATQSKGERCSCNEWQVPAAQRFQRTRLRDFSELNMTVYRQEAVQ